MSLCSCLVEAVRTLRMKREGRIPKTMVVVLVGFDYCRLCLHVSPCGPCDLFWLRFLLLLLLRLAGCCCFSFSLPWCGNLYTLIHQTHKTDAVLVRLPQGSQNVGVLNDGCLLVWKCRVSANGSNESALWLPRFAVRRRRHVIPTTGRTYCAT